MAAQLRDGRYNLRGHKVLVDLGDGQRRLVEVVTHTVGDRWMVTGHRLPERFRRWGGSKRTVVSEDQIVYVERGHRRIGDR